MTASETITTAAEATSGASSVVGLGASAGGLEALPARLGEAPAFDLEALRP